MLHKRKVLTNTPPAESSCEEWSAGRGDQWSCEGPGAQQALLLSAEEQQQQQQQLSPASFYDFSCSPTTAATNSQQHQQQQLQHSESSTATCSACGSASSCCCCSSLGLEQQQQQQQVGMHTLVDGTLTRQLSHVSQESGVGGEAATNGSSSRSSTAQELGRDSSPPSAALSPKVEATAAAAAAAAAGVGPPFSCGGDLCLPQCEDSNACPSLLRLTEAQWQQFRAQGLFKLGDKGRAIIKSRISRWGGIRGLRGGGQG